MAGLCNLTQALLCPSAAPDSSCTLPGAGRGCLARIGGIAMRLRRRNFLRLAAGAAALPVLPRPGRADTYPSRPVHVLCGFAPGGAADTVARLTAELLSERLGQQFVVDNRPGAGTNIATETVVQSAPDAYTLLLVTGANAINTTLFQHLNFR